MRFGGSSPKDCLERPSPAPVSSRTTAGYLPHMPSAAEYLPPKRTLKALEQAAQACRGCDLYKDATQTVFGEGRSGARLNTPR